MKPGSARGCGTAVVLALLAGAASQVAAQGSGLVGYAEAREREVRRTVVLPGTIEARRLSVVAAEVQGYVVEMTADEGDRVAAGEPLVVLRTVPYDLELLELRGTLQEARARLDLAASNLERARELFDAEIISRERIDDAVSESIAWQGRVAQAEARIRQLEVALDRCVVRVPFAGVVAERLTEVGQWIAQGGPVVELVADADLRVRVDVPERYFDLVRSGVEVRVEIPALAGAALAGIVESLVPLADRQARSFPLRARLSAAAGRLGAGMLADVALPIGDAVRAVVVPKDAVVRRGAEEIVFRLGDGDVVEPVTVTTGQGSGEWIVVSGDVSPGDRVVTRGNERLRPGQSVTASPTRHGEP